METTKVLDAEVAAPSLAFQDRPLEYFEYLRTAG